MVDTDNHIKQKKSILGLTAEQISEEIKSLNQPLYRSQQLYKWIYHHNVDSFQEISNIPKNLRDQLDQLYKIKTLYLQERKVSTDGTEKYLWKLYDNHYIESVFIPETRRKTICISSQVGCSLGCQFCATGQMGLIRNLSTGEIVEQVLRIKKLSNYKITNIVFMGMGEPFLNYPRTIQACKILGDPEGVAISNKRITISTSGVVPKIYQYTNDKLPFGLAISLHIINQSIREKLMPIAKKFPLDQLIESVKYFMNAHKRNRITFEYILLDGINDSPDDAKQLISLLSPIRCKLNVIPCNQNHLGFNPPNQEKIEQFTEAIMKAPFAVTIRKNRGEDIIAACGQLATTVNKKSIYMK